MKKSLVLGMLTTVLTGNAIGADVTLYYSPTCPHCHHAREFISQHLVYEYPSINVTAVNVMEGANRTEFFDVLKKCALESGGVPVIVVGQECFQGFGDASGDKLRTAIEVDMDDAAKVLAAENKNSLASDADAFRAAHPERADVIVERDAPNDSKNSDTKTNPIWFYAGLIVLVLGLGFVFTRRGNKK